MTLSADNVTIVIATADREGCVRGCIESLKKQGVPEEIEVLIIDAGREEPVDADAVAGLWANSRVVRSEIRNAGVQRNRGVREAAGNMIIFLDDDTFVQPNWWPSIVEPLEENDVGVVAGAVWCNPSPNFTDRRGGYINALGYPQQVTHRSAAAPRDVDWPMTTNMAVRKSVMEQIGGFSDVFGVYDEDIDLGYKIRHAGWRIVFQPSSAVYHYYATMQRGPATKAHTFRLGRNRSILLVRTFGLLSRVWLFLLIMPWVRLCVATRDVVRTAWTAYGHAMAYMVGAVVGVFVGWRHPPGEDVEKWTASGQ